MVGLTLESIKQNENNVTGFVKYINNCVERFISESVLDLPTEEKIRHTVNYELGKYYCISNKLNDTNITESVEEDLYRQVNSVNSSLNMALNSFGVKA